MSANLNCVNYKKLEKERESKEECKNITEFYKPNFKSFSEVVGREVKNLNDVMELHD